MRNEEGGGGEGGGGGGDGPNGPGHRLQSVASSLISLPPSVIIALAANDSAPPDPKTNRLNSGGAKTPSPASGQHSSSN